MSSAREIGRDFDVSVCLADERSVSFSDTRLPDDFFALAALPDADMSAGDTEPSSSNIDLAALPKPVDVLSSWISDWLGVNSTTPVETRA